MMDTEQILPPSVRYITLRTVMELAEMAIDETKGITKAVSNIRNTLRRKGKKGIWVQEGETGLVIHVSVAVCEASAIVPTCLAAQKKIKASVESITGLSVQAVCIKVEQFIKAYLS